MNSRERITCTLNHQEPDLVPIDLGSTIVTTITRIAYNNLRDYLKMPPDASPNISHRQMDTVYPMEDMLQLYQVDARAVHLKGPWQFKPRELPDDSFFDELDLHWKKASYYYDVIERPWAKVETIADLDKVTWPDPYDPGRVEGVHDEAKKLYQGTDYAIVADIMCLGPFEGAGFLRGYDNFAIDLIANPKLAQAILDKITDMAIGLWDVFLAAVGEYVQVVAQGDDLGTQRGLFTSPAMYRKFVKPCHKRLYDFIHSKTKAKVFMHSCGSVWDAIPDLIEVGVDILNPVQRSAAKMDISKLKHDFGKDLSFWGGGIDVQQVLPVASVQEIEDDVKRTLDIMAPGGGYVFVPAHNIQPDVTPERIHALYGAAMKYRKYPLGS
jgi:uroporphyrinogen decarboxylase